MTITQLIINVSIFFWLVPVFRQYKGNYFFFFLILALADPFAFLCVAVFNIQPALIHAIAAIGLFYSLDTIRQDFWRLWLLNLIIVVTFVIALLLQTNPLFLILIFHFLILIIFIKKVMLKLYQSGEFNWFYLILIFYEITAMVKLIVFISGADIGILYLYFTVAFQFLIAIFFSIFREESPALRIHLKPST
jgi:hypothetical protein